MIRNKSVNLTIKTEMSPSSSRSLLGGVPSPESLSSPRRLPHRDTTDNSSAKVTIASGEKKDLHRSTTSFELLSHKKLSFDGDWKETKSASTRSLLKGSKTPRGTSNNPPPRAQSGLAEKLSELHGSLISEIQRHKTSMKTISDITTSGGKVNINTFLDQKIRSHVDIGSVLVESTVEKDRKAIIEDKRIFLKAALQLLDERDEAGDDGHEGGAVDHSGSSTPNLSTPKGFAPSRALSPWALSPASKTSVSSGFNHKVDEESRVIMEGMLKKGKDSTIARFKFKYVVLFNSSMMWFPNKLAHSEYQKELQRLRKDSRQMIDKDRPPSIVLDGYAVCEKSEGVKYGSKHTFAVWNNRDRSSRRLWMCNTEDECDAWIDAIKRVIETAKLRSNEDVAEIEKVLLIQAMMVKVAGVEDYITIIKQCSKQHFDIPVAWIHQMKSRPMVAKDPGLEQVFKDLGRDRVQIDGELFEPSGDDLDDVAPKVIGALLRTISDHGRQYNLTASQALALARDTLLCCNRTESSGDAYEAVMALFSSQDVVAICPVSTHAAPIKFVVRGGKITDKDKEKEEHKPVVREHRRSISTPTVLSSKDLLGAETPKSSLATESNTDNLPFIRVEANTDYKICYLEDMTQVLGTVNASFRHKRYFNGVFKSSVSVTLIVNDKMPKDDDSSSL